MNQFLVQQNSLVQSISRSNGSISTVHLPKLNIPYSAGDYKEWTSFKDLFEAAIISNTSLSDSQRFQYLKGLLKGSPASLIRHLPVTDASFAEAWDKLTQRFDKPSDIATSFIKMFMEQPAVHNATVNSLRNLYDTCDEAVRGLKSLGASAENRDPWLIYVTLGKLDSETRELWSQEVAETSFPTFDKLLNFLNTRCNALETSNIGRKKSANIVKTLHNTISNASKSVECPKCKHQHPIYHCTEFKKESPAARKTFVVSKALCFRCLGTNHSVKKCFSKYRCQTCKGNHHSLLHDDSSKEPPAAGRNISIGQGFSNTLSMEGSPINQVVCESSPSQTHIVSATSLPKHLQSAPSVALLPTAVCRVKDVNEQYHTCRLLLDSGSQISLISEPFVRELGLKRCNARLAISGLSSVNVGSTKGKVNVQIFPRGQDNNSLNVIAFIMDNLTSYAPAKLTDTNRMILDEEGNLADPNFDKPSSIDIILGADKIFDTLRAGKLYDRDGHSIGHDSIFGWIMTGNAPLNHPSVLTSIISPLEDSDKILQTFWKIDEMSIHAANPNSLSEDERQAETSFQSNLSRSNEGRYIVSLPFKQPRFTLGHSRRNALTRLYSVKRRFARDNDYKTAYINFMREYQELGHMEKIPDSEVSIPDDKCFYLPHHAVFKNEPQPKIRVVFDGSCKTTSGLSLNDTLLVGPTIQRDLVTILLAFRKHKFALSADVQKMYRQVLVRPEDRDFQRILWREDSSLPIQHFRLKTVTYGTSAAPFLATRVLHQIGEENKLEYPEACHIIQHDFYVDDLLSGAESIEQASRLKNELINILQSSQLILTKWRSNIANTSTEKGHNATLHGEALNIEDNSGMTKVLGIQWNPMDDTFSFNLQLSSSEANTKRQILSESSRIFDPLGFLAPLVISIKILFQRLWTMKYGWDEILPDETKQIWQRLKTDLPMITKVKIPRRILSTKKNIELHGFLDASELAYGAVIYCRSQDEIDNFWVRIIAAKTRVAPLKQTSLPWLVLYAALLLTKLMKKVSNSLQLADAQIYAWTDSSVVLAWLSDIPRRWSTYVANRTSEIIDYIPRNKWHHVSSKDNPADHASRGLEPHKLFNSSLWWQGPSWLLKDKADWPSGGTLPNDNRVKEEERKCSILSHHQGVNNDILSELVTRCSSFSRVTRIVGYLMRFGARNRKELRSQGTLLSTKELTQSSNMCIKWIQRETFSKEIRSLHSNRPLEARSPLRKLNVFLDENGLLRVGGRLRNAEANFSARHPILLPKSHRLTTLLIRETHNTHLHPGPSLLLSILRQRYWILRARSTVRKICRECITCFKSQPHMKPQLMGDLPRPRVVVSRPFSQVGIDYAGPITLSTRTGRGSKTMKGYIALFVCFSTKALHLELVSSLSSEAFVAALRRFVSRRGIPKDIYCDNGTNFVGGKRLINDLHKLALLANSNALISSFLTQHFITWHLIPPGAPHFGGLWEAGVRSVKQHLKRTIGETLLGFEEMATLLAQVEAILNSRPLCPLSSDVEEYNALTPGHFLITEPLTTLPETDITEKRISHLGRWQLIQAMMQGFWKRWSRDYLSSLQERQKWTNAEANLKQGDLVVLQEPGMPPSKWLLGRVSDTHPGEDNLVRVVSVKTQRGIYKRALNKVYKLPDVTS